jgi:glucosamine--fructose-6-phosphate aminotransferase (isomerizing)
MCGIVGIIGQKPVSPLLLEALKRLEYRGYDSAGIATIVGGKIERRRAPGKLVNLETRLAAEPLAGTIGIGHTRWATHGLPNEQNAHPHATARVAVIHNGIIENHMELRHRLEPTGVTFESQTDTEVVAHLVTHYLEAGMTPLDAATKAMGELTGAFALAMIFAETADLIIAARRGSPLAIGFGDGEMFLGSDAYALAPLTQKLCYLEEGDLAVLTPTGCTIYDHTHTEVIRPLQETRFSGALMGKGGYRHFMLKEIFEQPTIVGDTLQSYVNQEAISLPEMPFDLAKITHLTIVACGTSYYAGMVGEYWIEHLARVPVTVDISSEFRYRNTPLTPGGVALFISQSGETADTLAAMAYARAHGQHIISIVNVPESSMVRASDAVLYTHAGPEISVASTKGFTAQLSVLACLALGLGRAKNHLTEAQVTSHIHALRAIPEALSQVLDQAPQIEEIAHLIAKARDVIFLGRGAQYPIALEGALKLKELSYIHAEAYAAGELKHGPIALIDKRLPVLVLAPSDTDDGVFEKTLSNTEEVLARQGQVILFSDAPGLSAFTSQKDRLASSYRLPSAGLFAPLVTAVPLQLLAYYTAVLKGTDVDQPRNLAKSVTVE